MTSRVFAVITGGGTGGHVSPALAVGEALVASGHERSEIRFVGGRRGIEGRLVPEAGFLLERLPGRGLQRRLALANLPAAFGLLAGVVMAIALGLRDRPQVVVTVGGYAGFAYAAAAVILRIPLVVVHVDAVPGAANRLVSRFAAANAVAFDQAGLPRATVTGPPVRARVLETASDSASSGQHRAVLGAGSSRRLVVATGGSLGAGSINEAVLGLAGLWSGREDVAIYHVAGERNLETVRRRAAELGLLSGGRGLDYRLVGFDPDLVAALAACDVAVCRAGASTVAELTVLGVPSILVPLPRAPSDHQTRNARALEAAGAAVVLPDAELDAKSLAGALEGVLGDDATLSAMSAAARSLGRTDAAARVAAIAGDLARGLRPEGRP